MCQQDFAMERQRGLVYMFLTQGQVHLALSHAAGLVAVERASDGWYAFTDKGPWIWSPFLWNHNPECLALLTEHGFVSDLPDARASSRLTYGSHPQEARSLRF